MGKGNFAVRFFELLQGDQCPDCGCSITTKVLKDEGPDGGDGLTEFGCSVCSFRLVSCGQVYSPRK